MPINTPKNFVLLLNIRCVHVRFVVHLIICPGVQLILMKGLMPIDETIYFKAVNLYGFPVRLTDFC